MLNHKACHKVKNSKNRQNRPERTKAGFSGVIPCQPAKTPESRPGGQKRGFLAFEMPDDLKSFFARLGESCPICPNCRNFVNLVRVDEQTGGIHCGECDQLLMYPDIGTRWRLLMFMADSGLSDALNQLNTP